MSNDVFGSQASIPPFPSSGVWVPIKAPPSPVWCMCDICWDIPNLVGPKLGRQAACVLWPRGGRRDASAREAQQTRGLELFPVGLMVRCGQSYWWPLSYQVERAWQKKKLRQQGLETKTQERQVPKDNTARSAVLNELASGFSIQGHKIFPFKRETKPVYWAEFQYR